jgi:hypothetical protein
LSRQTASGTVTAQWYRDSALQQPSLNPDCGWHCWRGWRRNPAVTKRLNTVRKEIGVSNLSAQLGCAL